MEKKKLMICEPMQGKTFEQVKAERKRFVKTIDRDKYDVVGNLVPPEYVGDEKDIHKVKNKAVYCLAESIDAMSRCDVVLFRNGWENARGCQIEHEIAVEYGLKILYEFDGNVYETLREVCR